MKTAVITGCNRGLGEGIKKKLLEQGYKIYGLNKTIANKHEDNYVEIKCDVGNYNDVVNAIKQIKESIDLLVVNAAIRVFDNVLTFDVEEWNKAVNTNLNGVFYVIKECILKVKKAKGDIVIVGSHSSKYTFAKGSSYCSTKAAIRNLASCLQEELRFADVRIIYLSLGSIKNRDHNIPEEWKLFPSEVAEAVYNIISLPKKIYIPYIDIRPLKPLQDNKEGIEKLQYV